METAAEAKAKRGPKATIRRQLTRVHTPATSTGKLNEAHCRQMTKTPSPHRHQAGVHRWTMRTVSSWPGHPVHVAAIVADAWR